MRVRLKGINSVTKRLADGRIVTYWYAWKGGPALQRRAGIAGIHRLLQRGGCAQGDAAGWRALCHPAGLSGIRGFPRPGERTRQGLRRQDQADREGVRRLSPCRRCPTDAPAAVFMAWRDRLAAASRRQADYAWVGAGPRPVVGPRSRASSLQIRARRVGASIAVRGPTRSGRPTTRQTSCARAGAPPPAAPAGAVDRPAPGRPAAAALVGYDGTHIRLRQSKTGVRVVIPVGAPLKAALDAAAKAKKGPLILVNSEGKPWTADGFRSSWRKACAAAGIVGVTFHDLRGTAVTRLALVGCTEARSPPSPAIACATCGTILDAHYLHRDPALAESAIRKLERGTKTPN